MIGVVQATETVKLILGIGDPLIGRLLTYDALGMRFREVRLRRDPKAALALVRSFEGAAGVAVDATDLETSADEYERQVNAAVATDPDVKSFVRISLNPDGDAPPERAVRPARSRRRDRHAAAPVLPCNP